MAGTKIEYEVTDGGSTAKLTSAAGLLRKEVEDVGAAATRTSIAVKAAMVPPSGGTKTLAAATKAAASSSELVDYGQARAAGGTGAAGRDFAKQSQGLGGLVHVYATFAANLFAVSAAFTALKEAADTTNMIKGLDQLGAVSGVALGSLSKRIVDVTDGAVSLREAMTATAQASSAGMTAANLERLAVVAKNASQTLGIGTPDALSRLSRGISKIEPELLDELGIFVKVDKATQDYAASLGKTTSSLTDFEKRQGFALAVLKQGEEKFSNIQIDANPYSKLLASIKDVAQTVLDSVNKILGPIAAYLSQNSGTILALMGIVTAYLLEKAVPAISQYSAALKDANDKDLKNTRDALEAKKDSFVKQQAYTVQLQEASIKATSIADTLTDKTEQSENRALATKSKYAKSVNDILRSSESYMDITEKQIQHIEKLGSKNTGLSAVYTQLAKDIRDTQASYISESDAKEAATKATNALVAAQIQQVAIERELRALSSKEKLSLAKKTASDTMEKDGFISGVNGLYKDIAASGANTVDKLKAGLGGTVELVGSKLAGLINPISTVLIGISTLTTAWDMLNSFFAKNTKESEATQKSFEQLREVASNVDKVLENISKRDPLYYISTAALSAKANALNELSTAADNTFKKIEEQVRAANWWDILIDTAKADVGLGLLKQSAKETAYSISQAFKAIPQGLERTKFRDVIKDISGVKPDDIKGLEKALNESPERYLELAPKLNQAIKDTSQQINNMASSGKQLDETFTSTIKVVKDMFTALQPTDAVAKIGYQIISIGTSLGKAITNTETAVSKLKEISSDAEKLVFFKEDDAKFLAKNANTISELSDKYAGLLVAENSYSDAIKKTSEEISSLEEKAQVPGVVKRIAKLKQELDGLKQGTALVLELKLTSQKELQPYLDKITQAQENSFARGAQLVQDSILTGFQKANIGIQKTFADFLGDTVAGAELKTKLQKQELNIQITQIKVQTDLARVMTELKLTQEESNLLVKQKKMDESGSKSTPDDKKKLADAIAANKSAQETLAKSTGTNLMGTLLPILKATLLPSASEDEKKSMGVAKSAAQSLLPYAQTTGAAESSIAGLKGQQTSLDILLDKKKVVDETFRKNQEDLTLTSKSLELERATLDIFAKNAVYVDADLVAKQNKNTASIANNKFLQDTLALNKQIAEAEFTKVDPRADKGTKEKALAAEKELKDRMTKLDMGFKTDSKARNILAEEAERKAAVDTFKFKQGLEFQALTNATNNEQTKLDLASQQLDLQKQLGAMYEADAVRAQAKLDLSKQDLASQVKINDLTNSLLLKQVDLIAKRDAPGQSQVQIDAIQAQIDANAKLYLDAVAGENSLTEMAKTRISVIAEQNALLAEQAKRMTDIGSVATSLGAVFGNTGKAFGDTIKAIATVANKEELLQSNRDNALKEAKKRNATEEQLVKIQDKYTRDSTINQIEGYADIASAAKGMFQEKSMGFKIVNSIEKAMHVASLAMKAEEMMADGTLTAESIANSISKAGANALSAITSAFSAPFPINFVAGAAMIGIMASLLGADAPKAPPAGFSAEEQQKVQGTGQAYDASGNLSTRAGGVLGDPTALAKSVTNALDTLSKEYFGGMGGGSSKIVDALNAIKENTGQTVKALLGKLTGFGGGMSAFGTTEGSSKVLGGLWGSSSTSITDAGIAIQGTIAGLKQGIGNLTEYENVVSKSSSWFGLSSSTSFRTNVRNLAEDNQAAVNAITNVFANVSNVLIESGKVLEGSGARVVSTLASLPVDIKLSTKGLTGQAAADALMAEISIALNSAAEKTFPYIKQYQKIGEEMFDTVARIVKESETLNTGLGMIGKTLVGANAEITTAMQQDLMQKAGGIEKLAAGIQSYYDNFLTATDRYNVSFGNLNKKFTEANIILPKSKDAYKEMVEGLKDLTDPKSRETLAFLLTNAEAYNTLLTDQSSALSDTVTSLEDSITKFRDFSKSMKDFRDNLLLSASSTATPMEKYVEAKTQFDSTYALALSGDKDAMGKLTSISQTFLDMSKTMFASSDQYTQDFNSVLDKINQASMSAAATADVEQLKLDYAKSTVDLLDTINANIALMAGDHAYAKGGLASGWSLVGERGPEMVNFSNPGQVYTADQTAGMFAPGAGMNGAIGAMISEIQNLREEVCQLRKDQQKQTGDIIISNYDANQKASEDIATAVVNTSQDVAWTSRSKSEIK